MQASSAANISANSVDQTLAEINQADETQFVARLGSIYEHSPWVARAVWPLRPFASLAGLKHAMQCAVLQAGEEQQLALIRAHPELAGKAAMAGELGAESRGEQALVGLHLCSREEFTRLQQLNADYNAKFGFPFILAVKGDSGRGLTRQQIISSFARRLEANSASEMRECLHQIGRIAEMRLNDLFGARYQYGQQILDWTEQLAAHSDEPQALTCAWQTPAHRACADLLQGWMLQAGMEASIDVLGNVVGRYRSGQPGAKTLLTGSHYDTVRNGGKYDGRLGILLPLALVHSLHQRGQRLPFDLEIVAFADEEGVRYQSTFLGSRALVGSFDPTLLNQLDAQGISMRAALQQAGAPDGRLEQQIASLARDFSQVLGFVEVHIEQGPVLLEQALPLGVVSGIAGCSRFEMQISGQAGHAGTTPMHLRRDAAAAAAEIVSMLEQRCLQGAQEQGGLVGTVGQLQVPGGSVNVIPGLCRLSMDIRSGLDATRLAAVQDILQQAQQICARRRVQLSVKPVLDQAAAACDEHLSGQLAKSLEQLGLPALRLPSGAGHDAMCMAKKTPIAMLFVRCGNQGISHHPLESLNADDAELAARAFAQFLQNLSLSTEA